MMRPPDSYSGCCTGNQVHTGREPPPSDPDPKIVPERGLGAKLTPESHRVFARSMSQARTSAPAGYWRGMPAQMYASMSPVLSHPQCCHWAPGYGPPVLPSYRGMAGSTPVTGTGGASAIAAAATAAAAGAAAVSAGMPFGVSTGRGGDRADARSVQPPTREALYQQEMYYRSAQMLGITAQQASGVGREIDWHSWASGEASNGTDNSPCGNAQSHSDYRYPGFYVPYFFQTPVPWSLGPNSRMQQPTRMYASSFNNSAIPDVFQKNQCSLREKDPDRDMLQQFSTTSVRASDLTKSVHDETADPQRTENLGTSGHDEQHFCSENDESKPSLPWNGVQSVSDGNLSLVSTETLSNSKQTVLLPMAACGFHLGSHGTGNQTPHESSACWERMSRTSSGASARAMPSDAASQNGLDRASSGDDETAALSGMEQRPQTCNDQPWTGVCATGKSNDPARLVDTGAYQLNCIDDASIAPALGASPYSTAAVASAMFRTTPLVTRDQHGIWHSSEIANKGFAPNCFPCATLPLGWASMTQLGTVECFPNSFAIPDRNNGSKSSEPSPRTATGCISSELCSATRDCSLGGFIPIYPHSGKQLSQTGSGWEKERYRRERVQRFLEKRRHRVAHPGVIRYDVRKRLADARPRIRGRFARPDMMAPDRTSTSSKNTVQAQRHSSTDEV
ncbi:hypothetical protein CCYA_CCYA16G4142 [Cyanidiococcus yangmingshanensis]|nr:hypothetical protein CCYA_CCYA16G4142 [Cyanidiococcus yangmingshanensis]